MKINSKSEVNPVFVKEVYDTLIKISENIDNLSYNDLKILKHLIRPSYNPLKKNI